LQYWVLNSGPLPSVTPPALFFVLGFFEIPSCELFIQGWLQTVILLDLCLLSLVWVGGFDNEDKGILKISQKFDTHPETEGG
jgi:hypothetical protein